MVRPNAEIIPSEHSLSVKIVTQNPISKVSFKTCLTFWFRALPPSWAIDSWFSSLSSRIYHQLGHFLELPKGWAPKRSRASGTKSTRRGWSNTSSKWNWVPRLWTKSSLCLENRGLRLELLMLWTPLREIWLTRCWTTDLEKKIQRSNPIFHRKYLKTNLKMLRKRPLKLKHPEE